MFVSLRLRRRSPYHHGRIADVGVVPVFRPVSFSPDGPFLCSASVGEILAGALSDEVGIRCVSRRIGARTRRRWC